LLHRNSALQLVRLAQLTLGMTRQPAV